MKVDINKTYKTKGGHPVVIYAIYEGQGFDAVHGAFQTYRGTWVSKHWTLSGKDSLSRQPNLFDLVEVRPEHVLWINEYEGGTGAVNTTKEQADKYCNDHRIALHRVVLNEDTVWREGDDE